MKKTEFLIGTTLSILLAIFCAVLAILSFWEGYVPFGIGFLVALVPTWECWTTFKKRMYNETD